MVGIYCQSKEDALRVLQGYWFWDQNLLALKPRHPLFDAREEMEMSCLLWINLPNLPLEFWIDVTLRAIGDALGKFIVANDTYKVNPTHFVARTLVDLDVQQGLLENLKMVLGDRFYLEVLDYVNILVSVCTLSQGRANCE